MLQGDAKEGSILEHLEELRAVIVRMLVCVAVFFPVVFYFSETLLGLIIRHLCPAGMTLKFFSPVEPLFVQMKIGFYGAIFISAPYLFFQVWGFIAPGLYERERKTCGWLILVCWILFVAGAAFSLFAILPLVMNFSFTYESMFLQAAIGIGHFVGIIIMLMLGFGLMFQFPAGIFVLVAAGLVSVERLKKARSYVFVGIFIVSALLTPPDIFSQVLMGLPGYLLFEIGLMAASVFCSRPIEKDISEKVAKNSVSDDNYESVYGRENEDNGRE